MNLLSGHLSGPMIGYMILRNGGYISIYFEMINLNHNDVNYCIVELSYWDGISYEYSDIKTKSPLIIKHRVKSEKFNIRPRLFNKSYKTYNDITNIYNNLFNNLLDSISDEKFKQMIYVTIYKSFNNHGLNSLLTDEILNSDSYLKYKLLGDDYQYDIDKIK